MTMFPAVSLPSVWQGKYFPCQVMPRKGRRGAQAVDRKGVYVVEKAIFGPGRKFFPVFPVWQGNC